MNNDLIRAVKSASQFTATDFVQAYGGKTAKAAAALGTSQRSVQRWLKGAHKPAKATQKKINENLNQKVKSKTIKLSGQLQVGTSPTSARDRVVEIELDNDQWNDLLDDINEGELEDAWQDIAQAYGVNFIDLQEGSINIE